MRLKDSFIWGVLSQLDDVLGVPSYFSLGLLQPGPDVSFGMSPRAFGAPVAGGSFAWDQGFTRRAGSYRMAFDSLRPMRASATTT